MQNIWKESGLWSLVLNRVAKSAIFVLDRGCFRRVVIARGVAAYAPLRYLFD